MYLCKDGAELGSQMDISTCTDACPHSKQGMGTEMRHWETYTDSAIQGHPCFPGPMHTDFR